MTLGGKRMFAYLAGVPLSEYIRRRKMSLAAVDLQSGDAKVIDIALKLTAIGNAFWESVYVMMNSVRRIMKTGGILLLSIILEIKPLLVGGQRAAFGFPLR